MKKRITALLLAFVMVLSVSCLTAYANEEKTEPVEATDPYFSDVAPGAWYYDAVQGAKEHGIMSGIGDGRFDPTGTTSRAMIVQIFYSLMGNPDVSGMTAPFTDIKEGSWYYDAVVWAYNAKIVAGMPDGTFHPTDSITREQFCVMATTFHYFYVDYNLQVMWDGESAEKVKLNFPETYAEGRREMLDLWAETFADGLAADFIDSKDISDWAFFEAYCTYMTWGLSGAETEAGRMFMPQKTLTRAEAATLFISYYTSCKDAIIPETVIEKP